MKRDAILALVLTAPAAVAQSYSVTAIDLDPGIVASFATDVTTSGRVVGMTVVESGRRTFGFVWRDGVLEQLVVPQDGDFAVRPRTLDIHHHVQVLAMSDGGYFAGVGSNVNFGYSSQPYFAWLPNPDPYPPQHVAAENMGNAFVYDIADTSPFITGVGAGSVFVGGSSVRKGFISLLSQSDDVGSPPRMTILSGFGGDATGAAAYGVNNAGDVVGYGESASGIHRPFVRPAGSGIMTDLGTLGGPSGDAFHISENGYIAGQADVKPGRPHAFVRAPGSGPLIDLGTLGGGTSAARSVNSSGAAVGESWTSDGLVHAFLWQGGVMVDLNSRIAANSGWVLTHAAAINDSGMIVGSGRYQGRTLAFVLQPAPFCYANCDGSTGNPPLTGNDFQCFLDKYVANDAYANCDGVGNLTPNDFQCFLNAYVAGCS